MHNSLFSRRRFGALAATVLLSGVLAGCGGQAATNTSDNKAETQASQQTSEQVDVRVAALKGPTAMGLVNMMDQTSGIPSADGNDQKSDAKDTNSSTDKKYDEAGVSYNYTISSAPDEVVSKVVSGDCDIALVPSNVASVLYNKTKGKVQVVDINTLGVLNVVTGNADIKSFEDLAGKTVYISGKGATPEYVMDYLLDKAGIKDKVDMQFLDEHTAVAAKLADDPNAVGILPQPFATATCAKNDKVKAVVNLNDVWDKYAENGAKFVMGVTIVNKDFAQSHPDALKDFLVKSKESVKAINDDPKTGGELVAKAGIIDKAPLATKAIPGCAISYIDGADMKSGISGFLQVLYNADPKSVGGKLPADDFYFAE